MLDEIFIIVIFLTLAFSFRWAFQVLPDEQWQIICCFPYRKLPNGHWQGWNLTWYGFFNAIAMVFAVSIFIILLGALSIPVIHITLVLILLLVVCLKAGKVIASLIEKKPNTATIGGASFIGIMIAPAILFLAKLTGNYFFHLDFSVIPVLAAMSIAYAFGEGIGRLACISFGCCYGKPLTNVSPRLQRIFDGCYFIFTGKTKKIAYAHSLDGQKVLPVQAMTTVIYSATGIIGCYLFLKGFINIAFILTLSVTQVWRFLSEFLRIDYRGTGKTSVYQIMALVSSLYGLFIAYIFYELMPNKPDLVSGLLELWNPVVILMLITLWVFIFFYTGKSEVTTSIIDIHVEEEKI